MRVGEYFPMSNENSKFARRADLDALRAGAMLLGIALHASLSFFASFWMVSDSRQAPGFGIAFSAVHGFRMPLFFVMSGFFSAMLLHRRGRRSLIKHRFHRVFLPLLLGMFTLVPATNWISGVAMSSASSTKPSGALPENHGSNIWQAARAGDVSAVKRHLSNGVGINDFDPEDGGAPLLHAAATGQDEVVKLLIERGADLTAVDRDGSTALHAAAFLGHEKIVDELIRNHANVNVANSRGEKPLDGAILDEGTTRYIASLLHLELNEEGLGRRKTAIAENLREHGATMGRKANVADMLMQMPLFDHLWFLWFLWWLVLGYAALSALASRLPSIRLPEWLMLSPARYLWLIPLTMLPQWFMGLGDSTPFFGPDTSAGLLPMPHVLAYYAIFYGFGTLYYSSENRSGRGDEQGWMPLSLAIFVVFPLGTLLAQGWSGPLAAELGPLPGRLLSVFLQAAYPWLMTFGLMGVFRRVCVAESPTMRYMSDSAYWLYLAHLPLIIGAQYLVRDWPIPALAKFLLIVVVVTLFLLWTYQTLVRYTWLGRFLNGARTRPAPRITLDALGAEGP
jgi:peptidoglycan/LPS O-acetylase OafA/YrhL